MKPPRKKTDRITGHNPAPRDGIRDRIKELRRIPARELLANPKNWRRHPAHQAAALQATLKQIGYADALIAYETPDGLMLIDGHLRAETTPDETVPVLVLDVNETEAGALLATLDPLAALAETDEKALAELQQQLAEADADLAAACGLAHPSADDVATDDSAASQTVTLPEQYSVLVECATEAEQLAIIAEAQTAGYRVRALCVGLPEPKPIDAAAAIELKPGEHHIRRESRIARSPRVTQLEGLFDVAQDELISAEWRVKLDLEAQPWNLGLIVGPSGSGKSTIAREIFGDHVVDVWPWEKDRAVIDGFPAALSIQEIVSLLSSVGFSSPPAWRKPFHVLSNGEQFRVNLARTLAEMPALAVVDEFTSVVDRHIAQIGSAAVAKSIRAAGRRFVAVTCHYDVEDWLQPDWKLDVSTCDFQWRCLRRRPPIDLEITRADKRLWRLFGKHHYLNTDLHRAAACFVARVGGQPAAFTAVLSQPHWKYGWWREHRTVCLPDFQGVGLGNAMSETIASAYRATGKRYRSTTTHPAMIRHRLRSPLWKMIRAPGLASAGGAGAQCSQLLETVAATRMTAGFEFIGPANPDHARALGILKT